MDGKLNVNLESLPDVWCSECLCVKWKEVYNIKRVSALISPNGKEGVVPIPSMICDLCGNTLQNSLEKLNEEKLIINN